MAQSNLSGKLIEVDNRRSVFRVSRRAFVEKEIREIEQTEIFDKCWLYLGHSSELAKPGAFLTRSVGGRHLIFNRDSTGKFHAFLNSCPHRGASVCRERSGQTRYFSCGYHGWVFGDTGKFKDAPEMQSYAPGFNSDGCADLTTVPQLDQYRDFWFICFDPNAVSLKSYLAGAAEYLDLFADQSEAGMEIVGGMQEYSIRANWKLLAENSFDGYHAATTHATYLDYLKNLNGALIKVAITGIARDLGNGHAAVEYSAPWGRPVANWVPAWGEAGKVEIDALVQRLTARHGKERAERIAHKSRNLVIFPNLAIVDVMALTVRTFYPNSADQMDVTAWALAPSEENKWLRKNRLHSFLEFLGPGGFATPDDVEMLEQCQRGYRNMKEAGWNDISRGMHLEQPQTIDEAQLRAYWTQWNDCVSGAYAAQGAAGVAGAAGATAAAAALGRIPVVVA